MVIHKYILDPKTNTINLPIHPNILRVDRQGEDVYVWAEVNPDYPSHILQFAAVGTGGRVPKNGEYVGTVFNEHRTYVLHFYTVER